MQTKMKKVLTQMVIVGILVILVPAQTDADLPPTAVLAGTVTDAATGLPLSATVTLLETGANAHTNPATGWYSLTELEGTYTAQAESLSYPPQTAIVTIIQGRTVIQDFALSRVGPELVVSTTFISLTLNSGEQASRQFIIANVGAPGSELYFSIQEGLLGSIPTDFSWIEEDPVDGTINAGDSEQVELRFDATGLLAGTYEADLLISHNDDGNPIVPVHIEMTVLGQTGDPPELPPTAVLAGTVTDAATGLPLSATVTLLETGANAHTNPATGWYSLTELEGTYTAQAESLSYPPQTAIVTIIQGRTVIQDFALSRVGPELVVSTTFISLTLNSGEQASRQFIIANVGAPGSELYFSIQEGLLGSIPTDFSWIEEDPVDGTINAGDSEQVELRFDATGLLAGTYEADLLISHNDDGNPIVPVHIEMTVLGGAPVAICQDVTVSANEYCHADVAPEEVDDGSYDPDGDPIILSLDPSGPYPLGETTVTLTVTDDRGESDQCTATVTVIDEPTDGFVTGGGWIDSQVDECYDYMQVGGKANFGFVSKYKKGATKPTGQIEFVFNAGDLNFHSTDYEWLVVTVSDYARFKGTGTINGSGEYKFQICAGDGAPDTFTIKIWTEDESGSETIVYWNGMCRPIGGGSIVIHAGKK